MYRHGGKNRTVRGFSLIELLVSVALFTVVMTVSIGTLLALVGANQKAQSLKSVINNLNFSVESMSRTIRTGHTYLCADTIPISLPLGTNDCSSGASGIVLTDDHGMRLAYRHNPTNNSIERIRAGDADWVALTAREVVVGEMRLYVTGAAPGDGVQPTVTMSIRGSAGTKETTDSSFAIQTTVTQRVLDE